MFTIRNNEGEISMVKEPSPYYTYTYSDYLKWGFQEKLELLNGKIFRLSHANKKHELVTNNLLVKFKKLLSGTSYFIFNAPYDVRLPLLNKKNDYEIITVAQPDLGVVCDNSKIDKFGCCGAPDLIVEILSPGNSQKEVNLKFDLYEEAGVKEYWIINPVEENVIAFTLEEDGRFGGGKMYASESIISHFIPELKIKVKNIFKN